MPLADDQSQSAPTGPPSVRRRRDALDAARDRAARTTLGLTALLTERPELRGVHAPADLAADSVRWSA